MINDDFFCHIASVFRIFSSRTSKQQLPLFCEQETLLMGQFSSQVQVRGSGISFEFKSSHFWYLQHFCELLQVLRPQELPENFEFKQKLDYLLFE